MLHFIRKRRSLRQGARVIAETRGRGARLVKLADKIANLRDVADSPPVNWPLDRRREYFDWAKQVVDAMPDVPPGFRALFDAAYAQRP